MPTPLQQRASARTSSADGEDDFGGNQTLESSVHPPGGGNAGASSSGNWFSFRMPRISIHHCLLGSFVFTCFCLILFYSVAAYNYDWADAYTICYVTSFGFTLLTCVISFRLIFHHLADWRFGQIQKYCVRIIFLLPIYAVESWCALYVRSYSLYIETARETYEAFAIWNFLAFVIALLGDEQRLLQILNQPTKKGRGKHPFPAKLLFNTWTPTDILRSCKMGVLQYVIIKNATAISACILESYGLYHEGSFSFRFGYVYLSVANNYSQSLALYCMLKFYMALKEELNHQAGKFIAIKATVFLTWWQSLFLNLLASHTNLVPTLLEYSRKDSGVEGSRFNHQHFHSAELSNWWTEEEIATGIQNFLITFEMFIASIFFSFFFAVGDIVRDSKSSLEERDQLGCEQAAGGGGVPNEDGMSAAENGANESDMEMQSLLRKDIGTVGPHSSLSAGPVTAKRGAGAGRVQQAAEAFVQSSVPSDLLSDFQDAGRDLYKYSMTRAGLRKSSIPGPASPGLEQALGQQRDDPERVGLMVASGSAPVSPKADSNN